jgi:hypothetical protein
MLRDRRTLAAIGALVVLGVASWMYFEPSASTPAAGARQGGAARRQAGSEGPLPAAEGVRLAALERGRPQPSDASRNLFRFESARPAPASTANGDPPALALKPVEPAPPSGPPPPPPITLKFIGVVEKADGLKLAVLTAGDGHAPMHGTEGDIIDGRYRILKIGVESIELAYVDGRGTQTIRLTGQ